MFCLFEWYINWNWNLGELRLLLCSASSHALWAFWAELLVCSPCVCALPAWLAASGLEHSHHISSSPSTGALIHSVLTRALSRCLPCHLLRKRHYAREPGLLRCSRNSSRRLYFSSLPGWWYRCLTSVRFLMMPELACTTSGNGRSFASPDSVCDWLRKPLGYLLADQEPVASGPLKDLHYKHY